MPTPALAAAQRQFEAAQASLRQAEANDLKAQDDVTRYRPLAAKDEIPQQLYTQAVDTQKATAAAVEAARASAAAAEQAVEQARAKLAASCRPNCNTPRPGLSKYRCNDPELVRRRPRRERATAHFRAGATEPGIHDHRGPGQRRRGTTISPAWPERRLRASN